MYLLEPVDKLIKELEEIARNPKQEEINSDLAYFGASLMHFLKTKTRQKNTSIEKLIKEHSGAIINRLSKGT